MLRRILWLALLPILIVGCGGGVGGGSSSSGVVTGNIADSDGKPIVDAIVSADNNSSTQSTLQGMYRLEGISVGDQTIRAEIVIDGVRWRGQNVATVIIDSFSSQSKNVNITMAPELQLGSFDGYVYGPDGLPVVGARVFAASDRQLSASVTATNIDGYYRLDGLISGLNYIVTASAQTYENDVVNNKQIIAGRVTRLSFNLSYSQNPGLSAPTGISISTWTVPSTPTRSPRSAELTKAYEAIKAHIDPRLVKTSMTKLTRLFTADTLYEIDLSWNFLNDSALLGYGIFRGTSTGVIDAIDYLRDPLANFYADQDQFIGPNQTYYYQLTALNTDYPDLSGSSSQRSSIISATPLEAFGSTLVDTSNLRFSWTSVIGADAYGVIVYQIYPDWDVTPIREVTLGNVNSWTYDGPALISGQIYYWVVIALSDQRGSQYVSHSFSRIEQFTAR
jgi:hypothetical protein